jgi:3-carboxy-cis,cis-muconate cycloisomerase
VSSFLVNSLTTTDALAELFSDRALLGAMLRVEAALARAEADAGLIPQSAAAAISRCARPELFDPQDIARRARASGTVAIPLVKALTERVAKDDPAASTFVHFGATSQDIADSALMLQVSQAFRVLYGDHARVQETLRRISDEHEHTIMLGRTLLQPALPITFGLKVAGWSAGLDRGWSRLADACRDGLMLQFGGAAGTLAALGEQGLGVARALASSLELGYPDAPWHTHRDRLAAILAACGIYTGTLGKIATDISLLMQNEVGEVQEPGGGSSTMPHKRNPAGCAIVIAAATRTPGLVATFLTGMVQEHERSVGGWHAEWPVVTAIVESTGCAVATVADVTAGLTVYPDVMRQNLEKTRGTVFAERARLLLIPRLGREAAASVIEGALKRMEGSQETFAAVLRTIPEVSQSLAPDLLDTIDDPTHYLGVAVSLRRRLLPATPSVRIG